MTCVTLRNFSPNGKLLTATYLPMQGMRLVSYTCAGIEVIASASSKEGDGYLIGPHFLCHLPSHAVKEKTLKHGIARYAAWSFTHSETQIQAKLCSHNTYRKTPLAAFEGQDFSLIYEARLLSTGLAIRYAIKSELPSLIGLDYSYTLPSGPAMLTGEIDPTYSGTLPSTGLTQERKTHLNLPIEGPLDATFIPKKREEIKHDYYRTTLTTTTYVLHVDFDTLSDHECSYRLFRRKNSSCLSIIPLSARSPQKPVLTNSTLVAQLQIFPST